MKRCPSCQRTYPDDSPAFCVNDGTRLNDEPAAAYDPQKTILASPAPPAPPPPQYSNPAPQPNMPPPPQQQPAWPPAPPQGQNWGGGYYPQPGQAYAAPKSSGLSMATLAVGGLSGVLGLLLFASYQGAFRMTRDTAYTLLIAAIVTGAIALVLGLIAVFSSRQRAKALAAVGMVLSAFSIGFWIYLEVEYGVLF